MTTLSPALWNDQVNRLERGSVNDPAGEEPGGDPYGKPVRNLSVLIALLVLLTACGSAEPERTAAGFNDADVEFATKLLPHHADAMAMVDQLDGRDLDPRLQEIADRIRETQALEIEQLTTWLEEWDQPVPETSRDHANAHDHEGEEGTVSTEDWITDMIEHHESAIELAETEVETGQHQGAIKLAKAVIKAQQAEIDQLDELRGV